MAHSLRELSKEDRVELMKWMKPCSVIIDVFQGKQNFRVRCMIHNSYECRCINRNQRRDRKKNYRCQTKQSDTSQQKQKKKKKSFNCVNKQFCKENNDILERDWLFEGDKDVCKVSNETLFTDHKDIDSHLVKSVKIECDYEGSNWENYISVQNVDAPVYNICTSSDRPSLTTIHTHPKIKEEVDNYEEISIINESIISIELHPVTKIEDLQDINENNMPVSDKSYLDEFPDNSNNVIETKNVCIVQKTFKIAEAVQREIEANVQLQNEAETSDWTLQSDLQIKQETNSRDYDATVGEEEYVNYLCMPGKRPFDCSICGKAFTQPGHLTRHKRIHTGEKPFGCPICRKAFSRPDKLTNHKRVHTGEKPFSCAICGKTYTEQSNLIKHKRLHTGKRLFCCSICGKAFTQHDQFTNHKRVHTGEKPFGCTICGKTFAEQSSLTRHKRIHTGEKPFSCTICGKVFTQHNYLTKHKRIHTRKTSFGCTICGRAFIEQSSLIKHKRIHTGEKPFDCTICRKACTRHDKLTNHKSVHTGQKPFGCII